MLSKEEFKKRFIAHMVEHTDRNDNDDYFDEEAESGYEFYLQDPDDMTPEEHAEEELAEWLR